MLKRQLAAGAVAVLMAVAMNPGQALAAGQVTGSVSIPNSPVPTSGTITVNGTGFALRHTGATIQLIMCSDPGGSAANLPIDNSSCDGSTINPTPIVPTASGTFKASYPVQTMSSKNGFQITCDATHYCVIWAGEDYVNKFLGTPSQPVGFSAPLLVGSGKSPGSASSGSGSSLTTALAIGIPIVIVLGGGAFLLWRRRSVNAPR